ncbi:MAG: cyclic 2,3-diphosphoglycerate synthase [candidate division WOR-3 bacterium]|nr:cyclic 2,3-diphosphoglycerate synthase [candidate division WOR-3 bacterium]
MNPKRRKVIIMGAAGRDFHNFNTFFRDNEDYEVVAFTASAQIPNIANRAYPKELAGKLYPEGIPIYPETEIGDLIKKNRVHLAVFSYSDVSFDYVMDRGSSVLAAGADFWLMGPRSTQIKSKRPIIAVCAVRTGAGKSQTTRRVCEVLKEKKKTFCVVRHPMPYGDLFKQEVQRFRKLEDLDKYQCTIEEREEYEPHIMRGTTVFAGVDYGKILNEAEKDFEIVVWDGGNNDFPFYKADLLIVVCDPLRAGHETSYHPGSALFRCANVLVINKMDSATSESVAIVKNNIQKYNPTTIVIEAHSALSLSDETSIRGKRVLIVEDGPTLTHGEMKFGAGTVAAQRFGAQEIIEPMPFAVGSILDAYEQYPHLKRVLPALGYGTEQIKELEETINQASADLVIAATPVNLTRILKVNKPMVNVEYRLKEISRPDIEDVVTEFLNKKT